MPTCTTIKTLQIAFTAATPTPVNGYIVKWRAVGDTAYNTVSPNPTTSPVTIPNVPSCSGVEGTIQTNCGGGNTGTVQTFFVAGTGYPAEYTLIRNNSCIEGNGASTIALKGKAGDVVVLQLVVNGGIAWDNTNGSGASLFGSVTVGSTSNSNTSAVTTSTSMVTANSTSQISVTLGSGGTATVSTTANINNSSVNNAVSANLYVLSINSVPSTVSTPVCIGVTPGA